LDVFAIDPQSAVYGQTVGDLAVFTTDPITTAYKRTTPTPRRDI
jgi:hypothetical protein